MSNGRLSGAIGGFTRGFAGGVGLGLDIRRNRRQEEAEKTLRELQEQRLGMEKERLELAKRSAGLKAGTAILSSIK